MGLVIDRYDTLRPLKQQTWDYRAKRKQFKFNLNAKSVTNHIMLGDLLCHTINKHRFAERTITMLNSKEKKLVVWNNDNIKHSRQFISPITMVIYGKGQKITYTHLENGKTDHFQRIYIIHM